MEKRGTYRWLSLMLALVFVLGLAGCAPEGKSSYELGKGDSSQEGTIWDILETEYIPEHVQKVFDQYMSYQSQYNLDYYVQEDLHRVGTASYEARIAAISDKKINVTFSWEQKRDDSGEAYQSWEMIFDPDKDWPLVKELLTVTFMITEPETTFEEATEKMKNLVVSYPTEQSNEFTDIVDTGDYRVFIEPNYGVSFVWVNYTQEYWDSTFKGEDQYEPIDYEQANNDVVNSGCRYVVTGIVKEWEFSTWEGYVVIVGEDGHEYGFTYAYSNNSYDFHPGEKYRLYGFLTRYMPNNGRPDLSLEYVEELS